jgi:NAD(P)-dependent dehydrogenase (short-subunit alcohol dehydrogenase family)
MLTGSTYVWIYRNHRRQLSGSRSNTIIANSSESGLTGENSATCRGWPPNRATSHILGCDASSLSSIARLREQVSTTRGAGAKLHCLLNSAGINAVANQTAF